MLVVDGSTGENQLDRAEPNTTIKNKADSDTTINKNVVRTVDTYAGGLERDRHCSKTPQTVCLQLWMVPQERIN